MVSLSPTPWDRLPPVADMDIGTIGFHNQKAVIKVPHVERNRETEKRIEKTRREEFPDLQGKSATTTSAYAVDTCL